MTLDTHRYLAALEEGSEALARAADKDLGARVPSCPGWDVAELTWHTGEVIAFWTHMAEHGLREAEAIDIARPDDPDLVGFLRAAYRRAIEVLRAADLTTPMWSWVPDPSYHRIGFVPRRLAQEVAVHAWDGQNAVGEAGPIPADLAADGIDEFLTHFLPSEKDGLQGGGESIHLHCTDVDGEWIVTVDGGEVHTERTHAKGDAAARGPAGDLLLLLWRRISLSDVDVVGDERALARFLERSSLE